MLIAFVFCSSFLFQTFTTGLQNSWLDDLDGPKFLRGAGQEIQDDEKLDSSNDSPNNQKRGAGDYKTDQPSLNGERIICNVAASAKGITTTTWNKKNPVIVSGTEMECSSGPFLTMVQLDKPSDAIFIPPTVRLLRCVGGCASAQNLHNCTVVNQEEVVLTVLEFGKSYLGPKNITVYNHTKCACDCIIRKSDCDEMLRVYKPDECSCRECKPQSSCNNATHRVSPSTCKCECKSAAKHCDTISGHTVNHEWNASICDCDCKEQVKKRCKRKGKVLNKSKCECECPPPSPPCTSGQKLEKSSCTCVDISVSTK